MARPVMVHIFTVRGRGLFPFDMLRHDRCTPARQEDSGAIERTTHRGSGYHTVTLRGRNAPNTPRWESFGWKVEAQTTSREV